MDLSKSRKFTFKNVDWKLNFSHLLKRKRSAFSSSNKDTVGPQFLPPDNCSIAESQQLTCNTVTLPVTTITQNVTATVIFEKVSPEARNSKMHDFHSFSENKSAGDVLCV